MRLPACGCVTPLCEFRKPEYSGVSCMCAAGAMNRSPHQRKLYYKIIWSMGGGGTVIVLSPGPLYPRYASASVETSPSPRNHRL